MLKRVEKEAFSMSNTYSMRNSGGVFNMQKRGQVTIFIVIAILLVAGVGLFFVFSKSSNEIDGGISASNIDVNQDPSAYMQDCLEQTLVEGIYLISLQGGYADPEAEDVDYVVRQIGEVEYWVPVYYDKGSFDAAPIPDVLDRQLETMATTGAHLCLENYENNREDVSWNQIESVNTIIQDGVVSVDVVVPVTATENDEVKEYDTFSASVDFDYNGYYLKAMKFLDKQKSVEDMIPLSLFADVAEEEDFVFEVSTIDENAVFIDLVFTPEDDDALKLQESNEALRYIYSFVLRYE